MEPDVEKGIAGGQDGRTISQGTKNAEPVVASPSTEVEITERYPGEVPFLSKLEQLFDNQSIPFRQHVTELTKELANDRSRSLRRLQVVSGTDMSDTDYSISLLHLRNLEYTRAKVLKHGIILKATQYEEGGSEWASSRQLLRPSYKPLCTIDRYELIREDLAQYCLALENYTSWKARMIDVPPFQFSSPRAVGIALAVLECEKHHKRMSSEDLEIAQNIINKSFLGFNDQARLVLAGIHEADNDYKKEIDRFSSRLAMALFGGCVLVVPMLIMVLHPSRNTSLITTSVFVVGFAMFLAWWMKEGENKDIIGATAAYAAVLVVFVGTAGTTTSS